MKNISKNMIRIALSCCLSISLCVGGMIGQSNAQSLSHPAASQTPADKVSPDLREQQRGRKERDEQISVILQLNAPASGQLNALLNRNGVHIKGRFEQLNSYALELPASVVEELTAFEEVLSISSEQQVKSLGHLSQTTGADAAARAWSGRSNLDGSGIGIAILDSGIDTSHTEFLNPDTGALRVIVNQDFTGEGRTDDRYGHGTHVASIAAGNSSVAMGAYRGIAPNANLLNLRVLNSQGVGTSSGLLGALNWVMANRAQYNIRVVNMSIGIPAITSYKNDPVCQAVRKLVDAGVVAVAAAGNNGKNSSGQKIYGAIHSPGNEPSAITVGASNTYGTDDRSDDTVTTYSSRGPTRSFWTDTLGTKHFDNLIKPDLVAPGNLIIDAQSKNNYLVRTYPQLNMPVSTNQYKKMMRLNGTSMATPIASGAVALMLQANPTLTPNLCKMILEYTAQQLSGFNMFEQGAGEINVEGAVRLAKLVRTNLTSTTLLGSPLLVTSSNPKLQTSINGYSFPWAQGVVLNQTYATGTNLITMYQKIYAKGAMFGAATLLSNGVLVADATMLSSGVTPGQNILTSNGIVLSEGTYFISAGVLVNDGVLMSDGVLVGDGVLVSDGVLVADGVLVSDNKLEAQTALINGDGTSGMAVVVDNNP
ncbi:MAG: S8 family peptidase [Pyrinomonadaceae bacterium]